MKLIFKYNIMLIKYVLIKKIKNNIQQGAEHHFLLKNRDCNDLYLD